MCWNEKAVFEFDKCNERGQAVQAVLTQALSKGPKPQTSPLPLLHHLPKIDGKFEVQSNSCFWLCSMPPTDKTTQRGQAWNRRFSGLSSNPCSSCSPTTHTSNLEIGYRDLLPLKQNSPARLGFESLLLHSFPLRATFQQFSTDIFRHTNYFYNLTRKS